MRAALLFDLDGTLTETDHLHFEAMRETLGEHGVAVDWPLYESQMLGGANADLAAQFLPHLAPAEGLAVMHDKEARFRARVSSLTRAAGLTELLAFAADARLPCAVVSNAPRANAMLMLEALGLASRFDPIVLGDELPRGKPDPLPYLTALATLGADARGALAFEDSRSGIRAAVAAGVTTIGVGASTPAADMLACGAALVARDFTDPDLWRLVRKTAVTMEDTAS
ncbi:MAG: HAD-IA family hydrolase [Methylobacteriaceae bacterium]|nr:HAD-IA family hydrolase [Methylobacteriaceae bacterium]